MKKILIQIKNNKLLFTFSVIESFLQVYGFILSNDKSLINFSLIHLIVMLFLTVILFLLNNLYFKILSLKYLENYQYKFSLKNFLLTWLVIFAMWIPVLLAYYPAIWSYDIFRQVPHFIGEKISYHHPLLHTLFIEFFLFIGKKISSYELGMLLLSLIQMSVMSLIFAYTIEKLKTFVNNKKIIYIVSITLIIYYGILPFNSILSISMTKDVLFSGFLLLLIIFIYDFIDNNISPLKNKMFIIISVLLLLSRNNSFFIYILFIVFVMFKTKGNLKKNILPLCSISLIGYYIITLSLALILKPSGMARFDQYSVQTQNMIYVVIKHPKEDVENDELLFDIIPRNCFSKKIEYDKNNADLVKDTFSYCLRNKFNDFKLYKAWIYYGLKYPIDYIDSTSNLTIGSWYLLDESHADPYKEKDNGYIMTNFKAMKQIMTKRPASKFKWLKNKLELIATQNIQYKNNNILRFVFCPATYILSFMVMIIYLIRKKQTEEMPPLILLVGTYLSILIGPVIILRYIYPFIVTIPVILVRIISKNKEKMTKF